MAHGLAVLEELNGSFVLLSGSARFERAEIAPASGSRIALSRIEPVLA
jgi:hypothetical protein